MLSQVTEAGEDGDRVRELRQLGADGSRAEAEELPSG
jgi:hypothetical protein